MKRSTVAIALLLTASILAACGGGAGGGMTPAGTKTAVPSTPKSVSPALVKVAPMAKTAILPASDMASKHPAAAINSLAFTQISGSASQVAAAPDGSIWVLSDQPAGPDKYIWHYANGSWTNVGGQASQIAIAPNGTLYVINSGGGTYAYSNGAWSALGGGASWITVAADNSVFVLTNGSGGDRAIWRNAAGNWTQQPGSGVALFGSTDGGTYVTGGGTISPGGVYILNSTGAIWYENAGGSFVLLPGNASSLATTSTGGIFALGFPVNPSGNTLYYYNFANQSWAAQAGSGVSVSSNAGTLYVVAANGGIYWSSVSAVATATPTPTPTPAPTATPTPTPTSAPSLTAGISYPPNGYGSENDPTYGTVAGYTQATYSQTLAAPIGSSITLTNQDPSIVHTFNVVSTTGFPANPSMSTAASGGNTIGGSYASGNIAGGTSVTIQLATAGTYYFGCAYHYLSDTMRDVIQVNNSAVPGPQATPMPVATDPPCYGIYC